MLLGVKFFNCVHKILSTPEVTVVGASSESGAVRVEDVVAAIRPSTVLISIMMAQNETGEGERDREVGEREGGGGGEGGGLLLAALAYCLQSSLIIHRNNKLCGLHSHLRQLLFPLETGCYPECC